MTNLLIHSMSEFSDLIFGSLECAGARHIVEIGAEFGGMSQHLADYASACGGHLTSIDPAPQPAFVDWAAHCADVTHIAEPSLDVIDTLSDVDAWVIDGDHNYFTVFNELHAVNRVCMRDGRPLLAFFHDVGWPWGRRDLYYAPERIPEGARHPYAFGAGVTLDHDGILAGQGFRGNSDWAVATSSGGPRNGVLTAIEDFAAEVLEGGRSLAFAHVPAVFGLGILFDVNATWSAEIATIVAPFHDNRLLATVERNRLRNYLKVIELQDAASSH